MRLKLAQVATIALLPSLSFEHGGQRAEEAFDDLDRNE